TWAELNARTNRCAHPAAALGVANGDPVALVAENLHQYAEVLYGCAKISAPVVNVNYRLTAAEVANVLRDTRPSLLVVSERFRGIVEELHRLGADLPPAVVALGEGSEGIA